VALVFAIGCAGVQHPPPSTCDPRQAAIRRDADTRAAPWSTARHLAKNFADGRVAWLMPDDKYQRYVVATGAKKWGRCNGAGCFVFVAPAGVIHAVVARSMTDGHHDASAIGAALGLPADRFTGPLRMMTLDLGATGACVRLPVDSDPGAARCAPDTPRCFQFGGYTSGGVAELIVIDAPIARTTIETVP
jgi:hypothetical protein